MFIFWKIKPRAVFGDLPGLRFCQGARGREKKWPAVMKHFLTHRKYWGGSILVMDVGHPLTEFDWQMIEWCQHAGLPLHILLTKADKLTYGAAKNTLLQVKKALQDVSSPLTIQLFSS